MRTLSDGDVLDIWARGCRRDGTGRALALLAAVHPELDDKALAGVTVAERDAAILALRQASTGVQMPAYVDCSRCNERLEFEFDSSKVGFPPVTATREVALSDGLRFRLPTSADLMAVAAAGRGEDDPKAAVRALARRCALDAKPDLDWSDALLDEVERALEVLDNAGDVQLDVACVTCGHAWTATLDVATYFWEEIEERATRLLDDVHVLASRYGWSEAEILALGEPRRRAYLERCDS
jgi:hypothetical protein